MITIGIDPGTTESGYVILDQGAIRESGVIVNAEMLELVKRVDSDVLAIEWIQAMGMAVGKEVFETCMWVGRFVQASRTTAETVRLIPRNKIKLHHCNSNRAKDANIAAALREKYGEKGTKKAPGFFFGVNSHAWQACAVAFYVHEGATHKDEIQINPLA